MTEDEMTEDENRRENTVSLPDLEKRCDVCGGRGGSRECDHCRWDPCGSCNGSGYKPTDFGKKVLDLMRHNFRPMLKDVMGD